MGDGLGGILRRTGFRCSPEGDPGRRRRAEDHGCQARSRSPHRPAGRVAGPLNIAAGKGTLIRLSENAGSVFVADPTVADVHVPSPIAVFVLGKKTGTTTLYVLGANNKTLVQRTVVVARDMDGLRNMIAARFPNLNVQLSTGQGSLLLAGKAASSADADAIVQAVTPYLADKEVLINRMTIDRPLQVQLRVRITEVDRNVTQQLGINWQAMGSAVGNFYGGIFSGRADLQPEPADRRSGGQTSFRSICRPTTRFRCSAPSRPTTSTSRRWSTR